METAAAWAAAAATCAAEATEAGELPTTVAEDTGSPDVVLTSVVLALVEMAFGVEQWMLDDVEDEAAKS